MPAISSCAWLFLLLVLKSQPIFVRSNQEFTIVKHHNMIQTKGINIKQVTVGKMSECFKECLRECQCSAFDMRSEDGETNTTNYKCVLKPYKNYPLKSKDGSSHFDIKQEPMQHCDATPVKQCRSLINCCLTSNPCLNGGECYPTDDIKARFKCACPVQFTGPYCGSCASGYRGKNCTIKITSCRGYANGSRIPGTYFIRSVDDEAARVFCDFEKDSNLTWTLVQSYSLAFAKPTYQIRLATDFKRNMGNPLGKWHSYRLSKSWMELIQNDSAKWRITCDFDKNLTAVTNDSVRGSKTDLDVMTWEGFGVCMKVDYINVRGYSCSDCTAIMYQKEGYPLQFDSFRAKNKCDFRPPNEVECSLGGGEDNFGLYNCVNPEHRCSTTQNSTTQTWLGG